MKFEELRSGENEEKEKVWQAIEQAVEGIKDTLGKGIDEKIKSAVVALRANGFSTTGSCEGHSDRAYPWPWVDVESPLAEKLLSDRCYNELKDKARSVRKDEEAITGEEKQEYGKLVTAQIEENEKEYQRLMAILDEFYKSQTEEELREVVRLMIEKGPWNQSRVQPEGVPERMKPEEIQKLWSDKEKLEKLASYRKEMERFSEFLKGKFFGQKI